MSFKNSLKHLMPCRKIVFRTVILPHFSSYTSEAPLNNCLDEAALSCNVKGYRTVSASFSLEALVLTWSSDDTLIKDILRILYENEDDLYVQDLMSDT